MPKALSPSPYVPSGGGAASRPDLPAAGGTSFGGRAPSSDSRVTVSALSHYSTSTAGLLDELQICSLDSPGASATPSPTLSLVSAYTSTAGPDDALTAFVASTAAAATVTNVIIPTSHCYTVTHKWCPPSRHSFGWLNQTSPKCVFAAVFSPFTNLQPQSVLSMFLHSLYHYVSVLVCVSLLCPFCNHMLWSLKASSDQKFMMRQNHFS